MEKVCARGRSRPFILAALALALAPASFSHALDAERRPTQYRRAVWRDNSGLPSNSVFALAQTADGYLWVGTEEGLVRFDGVAFVAFNRANTPALTHNRIDALLARPDGSLLVATLNGITVYRGGRFRTVAQLPASDRPVRFVTGPDGTVWAVTVSGLARFAGDQLVAVESMAGISGSEVQQVAADAAGALWIASASGIVRWHGGRAERIDTGRLLEGTVVSALLAPRDGSLWLGTRRGLSRYANGVWRPMLTPGAPGDLTIDALIEDTAGPIWVGAGTGLYRYRHDALERFDREGEDQRGTRALFEDREDNLWVGRYGGGLERFSKGLVTPFGRPEGLHSGVRPILETRDGSLLIGLTQGGIRRFANGRFTPLDLGGRLPDTAIRSLQEAPDGTLWIATDSAGVMSYRGGAVRRFTTADGLSNNQARGLAWGRDGALWVATLGGVDRIRDGVVHSQRLPQLEQQGVQSVYEAGDGSVWIGTRSGQIVRLVDGEVAPLPARADAANTPIQSFLDDGEGNLWIGTYGSGLVRFRDGRFRVYTTSDGLFNDVAFQIIDDGAGRLWITCNAGISVVRKADLDAFDEGRLTSIPTLQVGLGDGMRSRECNGGDPAGIRDRSGRLWIPTVAGVVAIDPTVLSDAPRPLPVIVERLNVDQRSLSPGDGGFLRQDDLEFAFTVPVLTNPERIRFRYRLDGFDTEWREAGGRRSAFYTNIPGGHYTFHVQATYAGAPWPARVTTVPVDLPPRFYQTRWFLALCAFAALGAVATAQGLRVRISEQRRSQQALRRSEERFRALVENSSDGVFLIRIDDTIEYASPSTVRILGYTPADLVSRNVFELIHPEDQPTCATYRDLTRKNPGKPVIGVARFRHADGSWRYLEGLSIGRFDEPAVGAMVLNYRDVTARRRQEAELQAAKDAAESSSRAKSEFLANVSHEIRTPMNGILGMTQLALEASSPVEQREYLELVKTSGHSLLVLINDILDLSKIEAGKLELEEIPFELQPLVNDTIKSMAWLAGEKGLTLSAVMERGVASTVAGDPSRLRQVLVNLLGNALKFTHAGSVTLRVTPVATSGDRVGLRFAVSDTGIGIDAAKQQMIFDKFTQADGSTSRKYGGSGLGLAICQHVVEMMGGQIWVDSRPGAGSTFHFTAFLGRAREDEAARPAPAAQPRTRPLRVLLAEDNPVNKLLAVKLLEKLGHQVVTAANGRQAVERLAREEFDVVLMDVQMPELNGFEATAAIRTGERTTGRHQYIIAMTAHALKGDRERCLEAGMDAYISKPIDLDSLAMVLAEAAAAIDGALDLALEP